MGGCSGSYCSGGGDGFCRGGICDCCRSAIVMCMLCHGGSDIVRGCSGCGGDCRVLAVMV